MVEYKDRLKEAMLHTGSSIRDLASALNISYQAVRKVYLGESSSFNAENNANAAAYLHVNPVWLATGNGEMLPADAGSNIRVRNPEDPPADDEVEIPVSTVSFQGGNGREISYEIDEEEEPVTYRRSFFQKEQINPARCKRFRVTGNSMELLLYHGDYVLVHMIGNGNGGIMDGKVYAIRYGDKLRIKRLYSRLDGSLLLRSENPDHKEELVPPELAAEHITIIGRVIDRSGRGGL